MGLGGDHAQVGEAVFVGGQSRARLKAQVTLFQMRVLRIDVGRVADDLIDGAAQAV